MKSPFIQVFLAAVIICLVMVVAPSSGPSPLPGGTFNTSGPAGTPGLPVRHPYGEVVFPITGPITPLPVVPATVVPYTPAFRQPTATYTPTFQPAGTAVTRTVRPATTTSTPTVQPPTETTVKTSQPTTIITTPSVRQTTATPPGTVPPATSVATPTFGTPTVTYTPTFRTITSTITPNASFTTAVTTQATATPVTTATPLYRNGPVYRYMINSGDLTGSLTVTSNPSDAVVTLDGYNSETTPWTYTEISSGYHTLEITYPGYEAYIRNIYLDTGESLEIDADLTPLVTTGSLFVDSTPQGANVYVDGNSQGLSPVTVNGLSEGLHQIELHLAGYEVLATTENVYDGQETDVNLALVPYSSSSSYGSIDISSDIPGALVYLDGIYKGITLSGTSFNIISVDPGSHTLLLHLPGYPDFTQTVLVDAGQVSDVNAVFSRSMVTPAVPATSQAVGGLIVTSAPTGGQVSVDNRFRGVTPVTIYNIVPGTHIVNINLTGYSDWSGSIDVPANQMVQVSAALVPGALTTPVPTRAGVPLVIILSALGLCGAFTAIRMRK